MVLLQVAIGHYGHTRRRIDLKSIARGDVSDNFLRGARPGRGLMIPENKIEKDES